MTKKQKEEIDFLKSLITWSKEPITEKHIKEYLDATTIGLGVAGKLSNNPLSQAQARLNITLAMWKEDMVKGLISVEELLEDAICEYEKKLIITVRKSVNRSYKYKKFVDNFICKVKKKNRLYGL